MKTIAANEPLTELTILLLLLVVDNSGTTEPGHTHAPTAHAVREQEADACNEEQDEEDSWRVHYQVIVKVVSEGTRVVMGARSNLNVNVSGLTHVDRWRT